MNLTILCLVFRFLEDNASQIKRVRADSAELCCEKCKANEECRTFKWLRAVSICQMYETEFNESESGPVTTTSIGFPYCPNR